MPEPYAHHVLWAPVGGGIGWDQWHDESDPLPDQWDSEPPTEIQAVYTADQMRAYAAAAVAMERERWTEAVMQELDSNGHAKAIVAAATACDHRWMVTQQGMTYHDCRCEKCGATKRESWD